MKYKCLCCENYTLPNEPPGTHHICDVCLWQDDDLQYLYPDKAGGANKEVSLNQARKNYKMFGAREKRVIEYVRKPFEDELPENNL